MKRLGSTITTASGELSRKPRAVARVASTSRRHSSPPMRRIATTGRGVRVAAEPRRRHRGAYAAAVARRGARRAALLRRPVAQSGRVSSRLAVPSARSEVPALAAEALAAPPQRSPSRSLIQTTRPSASISNDRVVEAREGLDQRERAADVETLRACRRAAPFASQPSLPLRRAASRGDAPRIRDEQQRRLPGAQARIAGARDAITPKIPRVNPNSIAVRGIRRNVLAHGARLIECATPRGGRPRLASPPDRLGSERSRAPLSSPGAAPPPRHPRARNGGAMPAAPAGGSARKRLRRRVSTPRPRDGTHQP